MRSVAVHRCIGSVLLLTAARGTSALDTSPFWHPNWRAVHDDDTGLRRLKATSDTVAFDANGLQGGANFTLTLGLHVLDRDVMRTRLLQVSDITKSETYGEYFSASELRKFSGPPAASVEAVFDWLRDGGIDVSKESEGGQVAMNLNEDLVRVHLTPSQAEALLRTRLAWHEHLPGDTPQMFLRAVEPLQLPPPVAATLSFVSVNGPIHLYRPRSGQAAAAAAEQKGCGFGVDAPDLAAQIL
ncbi:unnamed protein product, partial [Phaeothamnion confervicola]